MHGPPSFTGFGSGLAVTVTVTVGMAVGGGGGLVLSTAFALWTGGSFPSPVQAQASSPTLPTTPAKASARRRQY
ncbi:hypothetical protein GCM10009546_10160 [Actinomadura livida]|uniref:Uncharacterized protein n=1 Tax=Actinomadura livida TaxID=79909 RepID=A0ABP3NP76_9ACTN|nr:hypothetical protein GCM10010208_57090 [Actinomadura livida]